MVSLGIKDTLNTWLKVFRVYMDITERRGGRGGEREGEGEEERGGDRGRWRDREEESEILVRIMHFLSAAYMTLELCSSTACRA